MGSITVTGRPLNVIFKSRQVKMSVRTCHIRVYISYLIHICRRAHEYPQPLRVSPSIQYAIPLPSIPSKTGYNAVPEQVDFIRCLDRHGCHTNRWHKNAHSSYSYTLDKPPAAFCLTSQRPTFNGHSLRRSFRMTRHEKSIKRHAIEASYIQANTRSYISRSHSKSQISQNSPQSLRRSSARDSLIRPAPHCQPWLLQVGGACMTLRPSSLLSTIAMTLLSFAGYQAAIGENLQQRVV